MQANVLEKIADVLEDRKTASADESYVASLYLKGRQEILSKIQEEAEELVDAGDSDDGHLVHEVADLWFHCMVLLAHRGIKIHAVFSELSNRFGISGHDEKQQRQTLER